MIGTNSLSPVKVFYWCDPYLFKYCSDQIIKRYIPNNEIRNVLCFYHDQASGGHFSGKKIATKVL